MTEYIYETHMHTCQGSACSDTPGREYIPRYMDEGYAGIIITDHFYGGNCRVNRRLPWHDFITEFCSGYEEARNEGEKRGFPVFFGWEENFDGDEYLIYGLDKAWLLAHPDMPHWTRQEQYAQVRAGGGCVVQAHPFRARDYNHTIYLSPRLVDGVEGYNCGNEPQWNTLALRYAAKHGLPVTAGSDNHHVSTMRKENLGGVVFDRPLNSIHDYVDAILNRKPFRLHVPFTAPEWTEKIQPELPVVWVE